MNRMNGVLFALLLATGASAVHSQVMLRKVSWDVDRLAVLLELDEYQKSEVARVLNERPDERHGERPPRRPDPAADPREHGPHGVLAELNSVLGEDQLVRLGWLLDGCEGGLVHRPGGPMSPGGPGRE